MPAGGLPPIRSGSNSLAGAGALAVGVDTDVYLARVASKEAPCDQLVGDAEGLSRQLQREHGGAEYFFPILTGVGKGGALAGAILAQTPPATLGGAVSLDPWAVVQTSHGFCTRFPSDGVEPRHWRVPILNRFWSVALTPATPGITRAHFETLQALSPDLEVQTLSARRPDQTLASLVAPHLVQDDFSRVGGLPLIELPASKPSGLMAVFLSGDGGWRDIDKTIAENLQSLGVSVVGWDSVRYFWQSKTPQQTAADLSAVILDYSAKWHADKVALIGFSFGADTLPFAYDRLRPSLKQHVAMISLLSLGRAADWEIRVVGWLGAGPSAAGDAVGAGHQGHPRKNDPVLLRRSGFGLVLPRSGEAGRRGDRKEGHSSFRRQLCLHGASDLGRIQASNRELMAPPMAERRCGGGRCASARSTH